MNGTRVVTASVIALVMVLLQWLVPLQWNTTTAGASLVSAFPAQLAFFAGYGVLSMLALWGVFRLVWPSSDE